MQSAADRHRALAGQEPIAIPADRLGPVRISAAAQNNCCLMIGPERLSPVGVICRTELKPFLATS